jgi:hypothetical protein
MEPPPPLPEALDACADRLEQLNHRFPGLASEVSRAGVALWRQAKIQCQTAAAKPQASGQEASHRTLALRLLEQHSLEETAEILLIEHGAEYSLPRLVQLVGQPAYVAALRAEARQLSENAISYQQIAGLWNDLRRPPLGADRWSEQSVTMLAS